MNEVTNELEEKLREKIMNEKCSACRYNTVGQDEYIHVLEEQNRELEKEKAELKSRDCWKSCEYVYPKSELIGQHIKDVQNLTKAKEIIRIVIDSYNHKERFSFEKDLMKAEQFLNSEVEK